jgi:hypothetical protein
MIVDYKNKERVKELTEEVNNLKHDLSLLETKLSNFKREPPEGYEFMMVNEIVTPSCISFEPCHSQWMTCDSSNSVGQPINDQLYVTWITHRGWKYAKPKGAN